jgi:hypothetical protein
LITSHERKSVFDASCLLEIDRLNNQEEEELIPLSVSKYSSINNIKSTFPMHTALIFKNKQNSTIQDSEKKPYPKLITQYNILKGMIDFITKITNNIYITQSLYRL